MANSQSATPRSETRLPAGEDCILAWPPYYPLIKINIRQAQPSDRAVIAEFNLRLAKETEGLALDPALVAAGVETLLGDPSKGLYYVAEAEQAVVGQVMITYEWSDWRNGNIWWLQSVFVAPEFRRRGVFRALFNYLTDRARADQEVCGLRLYMHDENAAARKSYLELGMKPTHYQVFEMGFPPRQGP